jgi:hypothetical protein
MARKPIKTKEEIAAIPVDQEIEVDVSDIIVPVINDLDDKDGDAVRKDPPPVRVQQDDGDSDLRKQVESLKRAEETARAQAAELSRQVEEAKRQTQELQQQNSVHQNSALEAEYDSVLNAINAAETEAEAATQAYDAAFNASDGKAMAEAQRKISRAEARLESLEQGKSALEARREAAKNAPRQEQTPSDPFEAYVSQFPQVTANWLRSHSEYVRDQRKNVRLQGAHFDAVEAGKTVNTPEYLEFIEEKLGLRQTDDDTDPDPPRRTPVSAPVSRDIPSPSTGRSVPSKVTLTPDEREAARFSFPDTEPGEAERLYAQQKLRLMQEKANGRYNERG